MHMAVITDHKHWTAADLREIPDDRNRYEIIDGELFVTPAPSLTHQEISKRLLLAIHPYLEAYKIGNVVYAPADVVLADDTVVEPDLFVFRLSQGKLPQQWKGASGLLLVIEILSPSTARVDRTGKRRRYQRERIPEYWIVDGDAGVVERWRPEDDRPEIITERLEWRPDSSAPPLVIHLPILFAGTTRYDPVRQRNGRRNWLPVNLRRESPLMIQIVVEPAQHLVVPQALIGGLEDPVSFIRKDDELARHRLSL